MVQGPPPAHLHNPPRLDLYHAAPHPVALDAPPPQDANRPGRRGTEGGHWRDHYGSAPGLVDDLVSPDDNIDLATGGGFVYLDVPSSGHADVIEMDDSEEGMGRREVFDEALDADPADLRTRSLQPADQRIEPDRRVKNVIFVIHGIRDMGYWTQKIARRVMERWREEGRIGDSPRSPRATAITRCSRSYSPAAPREGKWLMDQYTEGWPSIPRPISPMSATATDVPSGQGAGREPVVPLQASRFRR